MAGCGTGSPLYFLCPALRRIWPRTSADEDRHATRPTGRHRKGPRPRNGSIRRVQRTMEYRCSCGRTGWSTHSDLASAGVAAGLFTWDDVDPGSRRNRGRNARGPRPAHPAAAPAGGGPRSIVDANGNVWRLYPDPTPPCAP